MYILCKRGPSLTADLSLPTYTLLIIIIMNTPIFDSFKLCMKSYENLIVTMALINLTR